MSRDELHAIANRTTPPDIQVSKSSSDLITWAIGKFGSGALFAMAAVYIYSDLKMERKDTMDYQRETTSKLIVAFESSARAGAEQARAISDLAGNVEENTRVLRALAPRHE